jgi:hypothetical protein
MSFGPQVHNADSLRAVRFKMNNSDLMKMKGYLYSNRDRTQIRSGRGGGGSVGRVAALYGRGSGSPNLGPEHATWLQPRRGLDLRHRGNVVSSFCLP